MEPTRHYIWRGYNFMTGELNTAYDVDFSLATDIQNINVYLVTIIIG